MSLFGLSASLLVILSFSTSIALANVEPNGNPTCANPSATCQAYGVDFQNGGSYFQNTLSSDDFTFVSQFSGCANDTAANILVAPNGVQYACSNTSLTPDFTNEQSTCQELKSSLYTGQWNLIIVSNNGGCAPLAAQRSFSITAGPQATVTYTPTVTFTTTTTPVVTSTTTDTLTVTVTPASAAGERKRHAGLIPRADASPTIETTTVATSTITSSTVTASTHNLVPMEASCSIPPRAPYGDPLANILPTLAPGLEAVVSLALDIFKRDAAPEPTAAPRLTEREAKNARQLAKRAPDSPTITVTDSNTADFSTTTSVVTATPATTYTEVDETVTVTAAPSTTAESSTFTRSKTDFSWHTQWVWTIPTISFWTLPAPPQQTDCHHQGGQFVSY